MKKKNKGGRPSEITGVVVAKLEQVLKTGLKVKEACILADIHPSAYYRKYAKNKEFRNKMNGARKFILIMAQQIVAKAILENKSLPDAWKLLEKRDSRYKNNAVTINNKNTMKSDTAISCEPSKKSTKTQEEELLRLLNKYGPKIRALATTRQGV